jgi:hypothetical protein
MDLHGTKFRITPSDYLGRSTIQGEDQAMTRRAWIVAMALAVIASVAVVRAADPTGRWTATFPTEIGEQSYTFEFAVKGTALTGTIKGSLTGESPVTEGKVDGDKITFVESVTFMEMPLRITYSGAMTSADEITFTRNVADIANEELVAKRVK